MNNKISTAFRSIQGEVTMRIRQQFRCFYEIYISAVQTIDSSNCFYGDSNGKELLRHM